MSSCSWARGHLKAHRLHPPGDFCSKEQINVNDSADYFGAIGVGRVTHVAIQHWVGILPKRRAGSRACDFAYSGTDGPSVTGGSTSSYGWGHAASLLARLVKLRGRCESVPTLVQGFDKLVDEIG